MHEEKQKILYLERSLFSFYFNQNSAVSTSVISTKFHKNPLNCSRSFTRVGTKEEIVLIRTSHGSNLHKVTVTFCKMSLPTVF
jgi:hypothetical protein